MVDMALPPAPGSTDVHPIFYAMQSRLRLASKLPCQSRLTSVGDTGIEPVASATPQERELNL